MNPPRSFYRTSSNMDSYEDKLIQNESTKANFPFFNNNSFHVKQRRSTQNHSMGDGGDRFGIASTDKSAMFSPNKSHMTEEDILKTVISGQKWGNNLKLSNEFDEDENNYETNDFNGSIPKYMGEKYTMPAGFTASHTALKDNDADILNDMPNDLPEKRSLSYCSTEESPIFKSSYLDKVKHDKSDINILMLVGLLIALLASKCLQYLQLYMEWFKNQIGQLRGAFLDDATAWEIFDFDKKARFNVRSKLILVPVLVVCGILNGVIGMMHFAIKIMLAPAPQGLTQIVRKLSSDAN